VGLEDFRSYGILRSVFRELLTDVSGQPIGSIVKGQAVQEDGTDKLSLNVVM
jgi:hypothetical protein